MKFGIDRMLRLTAALGHPERAQPVIHVAGTNGKGSVSAMIESILRAAGHRTGLYTSPHLVRLGERVQVDRRELTEDQIVAYVRELGPVAARAAADTADEHATFFEFMTAMAFLQFQRSRVNVAVVEVGMGGRLDATNVVVPEVSIVTSIGLDHCAELGNTIEEIAREKAGIIKPHRPVVLGRMPEAAEREIRAIARIQQAPVHSVRELFGNEPSRYPEVRLEGEYQRWNAATATLAVGLLPAALRPGPTAVREGLERVSWPGRWQRLAIGGRAVILDAAHNPDGAVELDKQLATLARDTGRRPIIVAGALGEFRARALLGVILRHAGAVHLVTPNQSRATPFEALRELVPVPQQQKVQRGDLATIFPDAKTCTLGLPGDTVVVTGSIYLLGEVLERLAPNVSGGENRLQDF